MDRYEEKLAADIQLRRAEVIVRAQALRHSIAETFDPRERVKRHPLGGLLTSLGAGVFLSGLLPGRTSGRANGSAARTEAAPAESSLLSSLTANVLSSVLPGLLPVLIGPLMALLSPGRGKKNSHPPAS